MIQIRSSCFETNSSSTHCLVITTEDEWNLFKKNKLKLNLYTGELLELDPSDPKVLSDGRFEYSGQTYESLLAIDPCENDFDYCDRSGIFYDAYQEESKDIVIKQIKEIDKLAISIYVYDD